MKKSKFLLILLFLTFQIIFFNIGLGEAAEILFIDTVAQEQTELINVKLACDLLGIKITKHFIESKSDPKIQQIIMDSRDKEAIILSARVLQYFNKDDFSSATRTKKINILISDISSSSDIAASWFWAENKIISLQQIDISIPNASIKVAHNQKISRELGGLEHPLRGNGTLPVNRYSLASPSASVLLIALHDLSSNQEYPLFIRTESAESSIFFLMDWKNVIANVTDDLIEIMPLLMFLKYAFGDRCWHSINDFANFTIDDPWLREPYGYISFADLCKEAKQVPFHITIGFIPYNYKKSRDDAVDIFRRCSDNLSIAIHGNNHDFKEFRNIIDKGPGDKLSQSVHPDEKSILQALHRMDKFTNNTGIAHDRVMIFPRGAFTKESLGLLKKQNFLMTINSTRPIGADPWSSDSDRLRRISTQYESFPMVLRYGLPDRGIDEHQLTMIKNFIQMRMFLDLPVFLYAHAGFFKTGSQTFNTIAEFVNKTQDEVIWSGLAAIAQRLYLQRKISDHEIELLAYSSHLVINNNYPVRMNYIVKKEESCSYPIEAVHVDGIEHIYLKDGTNIRVEVLLEPGEQKSIQIYYHADYHVDSFTYSDKGFMIFAIRALSDFRDIYLPRIPFGDKLIMFFYRSGGTKRVLLVSLIVVLIISSLLVCRFRKIRGRKAGHRNDVISGSSPD